MIFKKLSLKHNLFRVCNKIYLVVKNKILNCFFLRYLNVSGRVAIRIRDPVFLGPLILDPDPGNEMQKKPNPGSEILDLDKHLGSYIRELTSSFLEKYFHSLSISVVDPRIRDGKSRSSICDPRWIHPDPGAGVNILDPQHWSQIKQEIGKKFRTRSQCTDLQVKETHKKKKRTF
jgi:hypothetical protein